MPEDAKFPFEYDDTGDYASVTGEDFYVQHALQLGLIAGESTRGGSLAQNDIIDIRDRVGKQISQSPYFDQPIIVNVTSTSAESITLQVKAPNVTEFEITV